MKRLTVHPSTRLRSPPRPPPLHARCRQAPNWWREIIPTATTPPPRHRRRIASLDTQRHARTRSADLWGTPPNAQRVYFAGLCDRPLKAGRASPRNGAQTAQPPW
jgi:hypothetical protein